MKDVNIVEKRITRELKDVTKNKDVKWLEWSSSEKQIDTNLAEGETKLYLPLAGVWIAYK